MCKKTYRRVSHGERPLCVLCGAPYHAGSTQGRTTYYYPTCRCLVANRKLIRQMVPPSSAGQKHSSRRFRVYPMPEIDRYVVITPGGASLPLRPLERDEAEPLIALLNEYVLEE